MIHFSVLWCEKITCVSLWSLSIFLLHGSGNDDIQFIIAKRAPWTIMCAFLISRITFQMETTTCLCVSKLHLAFQVGVARINKQKRKNSLLSLFQLVSGLVQRQWIQWRNSEPKRRIIFSLWPKNTFVHTVGYHNGVHIHENPVVLYHHIRYVIIYYICIISSLLWFSPLRSPFPPSTPPLFLFRKRQAPHGHQQNMVNQVALRLKSPLVLRLGKYEE